MIAVQHVVICHITYVVPVIVTTVKNIETCNNFHLSAGDCYSQEYVELLYTSVSNNRQEIHGSYQLFQHL
jgi:hypothetical protein